ncbi:hypothetical protein HY256_01175 [Candidatus Sumerlaeota bacterium]|nr:hypothetical protein [Candidatus Sumerlaeota bacterium]
MPLPFIPYDGPFPELAYHPDLALVLWSLCAWIVLFAIHRTILLIQSAGIEAFRSKLALGWGIWGLILFLLHRTETEILKSSFYASAVFMLGYWLPVLALDQFAPAVLRSRAVASAPVRRGGWILWCAGVLIIHIRYLSNPYFLYYWLEIEQYRSAIACASALLLLAATLATPIDLRDFG